MQICHVSRRLWNLVHRAPLPWPVLLGALVLLWGGGGGTPAQAEDRAQSIATRSYGPQVRSSIVERSAHGWGGSLGRSLAVQSKYALSGKSPRAVGGTSASKGSAWEHLVERYSRKHRLDPHLVRAIIQVESAGDPAAVSRHGAAGLMQLMPSTAARFGATDVFDPEQNIASGTAYLRSLLDQYHSVELALWAYNAGPSAVARGHVPDETRSYVPKVLRLRRQYRMRSGGGS